MTRTLLAALALVSASAVAQETPPAAPTDPANDPTSTREEAMFGESAPDTPAPAPQASGADPAEAGPSSREDSMFGEDVGDDVTDKTPTFAPESPTLMQEQEQALAVGGQLFLRFNGGFREGDSITDVPLSSPSLADVFADVRPTDRVRGFGQVRFSYDFTVQQGETNLFGQQQQQFQIQLDQLWVKFDLGRVAYVTAGRQRIRWGTGRFWNPTDFVNQDIRNSVDFFDQRLGVNLLKVHFPFEALGWNLYLLGAFDGVDVVNDTGVGARGEFLFGQTEVALSTLIKKDQPLRLGFDVSTGIWLFDLRAEGTLQRGLAIRRFEGELDFDEGKLPEEVDTDGEWFFQGVFGGDITLRYSDQDSVILGGEYFYNQTGYDDASLYPFLALNGAFVPLYLGKHYAAGYLLIPNPLDFNNTSITISNLANLSDLSSITRVDWQQTILTYLTFNAFVSAHWGRVGEFKLGLEVPPIPGVLPDGIDIPTQQVDVGVALRMSL